MMAEVAALDPEFGQDVLARRIVMGAAQQDRVRLHGHGCRRMIAGAIREQLEAGSE
jgi:hypothetical protein